MSTRPPLVTRIVGPSHGGRFAALEGYRGLAALSVAVYHCLPQLHPTPPSTGFDLNSNLGSFGVAVFFLLSGFLLYLPITRSLVGTGRAPHPAVFLLRRFVRIYPAYWLALVGWGLVSTPEGRDKVNAWRKFLLLDDSIQGLGVAWTLTVEVAFYLFLAVLAVVLPWVCSRLGSRAAVLRLQVAMLVVMAVSAHVYRWWASQDVMVLARTANFVLAYGDWFAIGMAMAIAVAWHETGGRLPSAVVGLADHAWVCFLLAAFTFVAVAWVMQGSGFADAQEVRSSYLFRHAVQGIAAGAVLLPAMLGNPQQRSQRWLRGPVLAGLGTVSYGVYLWHTVVLIPFRDHPIGGTAWLWSAVNFVVVIAITLVIATLSYRLVERPALSLVPSPSAEGRTRQRPSRVAVAPSS